MRKYSSFFEGNSRNEKEEKELSVAEEMVNSLRNLNLRMLHNPRNSTEDPPDCVCLDEKQSLVAIEITEIVCEAAVRLNEKGENVYREWRPNELIKAVASKLIEKDYKDYKGGPYSSIIVCLFTDELALTVEQAKSELINHKFGPFKQITEAYLLFSYRNGIYPLVSIQFNK